MKKILVLSVVISSILVQLNAETQHDRDLESALANSKAFLKKVEQFENNFYSEKGDSSYPSTSKGVAKAYCLAYAEVDFNKALQYFEKGTRTRAKKDLDEVENAPSFYEYKDEILSNGITCEIDSLEENDGRYETYVFKSDLIDPVFIDKVDGKFVIVDREYVKNKGKKSSQSLIEKAEEYIQQDYEKLETVKAYYPPTSEKLAIASCEAIKSMDWDTLYDYTAPSFHDTLKVQIQDIEMKKDEYKKDFETFSCKIESSDYQKNLKVKYHFNGLGAIYVAFLPELKVEGGWKVIGF